LVQLVRCRGGEAAVEQLLALAGESRTAAELEDVRTWSTFGAFRVLLEATATLLEDVEALRDAGGQALLQPGSGSDVAALLRSLGTPGEVLRRMPQVAAKLCTVVDMEAIDTGDGFGLVRAVSHPGFSRYPALCEYTAGLLAQVPTLFDLPEADVVEVQCETRGDPQCLFRLVWPPAGSVPVADAVDRAYAAISGRFEALRDTVADLISGDDVDTVLARIAGRAGLAVRAPRHLLAIRAGVDGEVRVHHRGFTDAEAADDAVRLLSDDIHDRGQSWVVADVASSRRHYGRLAAVHVHGAAFFPEEQAVLSAYARLAAAALDAATAVDDARREAAVAHTLLNLAAELASTVSVSAVAQRIADAVPRLVDADAAGVWLWDVECESLALSAQVGFTLEAERALTRMAVGAVDSKALRQMLDDPRPRFASADSAEDRIVTGMLELSGHCAASVVPIAVDGTFLGAVAAGVVSRAERIRDRTDVTDRLSGLAQFAALAIRNALLVDEMRHRAHHDPLTGLPNQRLLADRLDRALAHSTRTGQEFALLYLDLDRLKHLNDNFGHTTGDSVLRHVARRLQDTVRAEDTVARVGGDEFVLLLPRVSSAEEVALVADKVRGALAVPIECDGQCLEVTVSIGVALAPSDGRSADELLRVADAAMYIAKRAGRNRVAWGDGPI
jgi:diguanylate cyclase (GGDEF)-like protein